MASLHSIFHETGRQFISLHRLPDHPTIKAVLLGGSSICSAGEARDEKYGRDWDGAIIVPTKLAILYLVNEQRRSLIEIFGIVREEHPEFMVPDSSSSRWDQFDAVRFAGFDRLEIRRSVKILSLDYFSKPKVSLNILSFKDKRVFEAFRPPGTKFYRVQQASRLEDGLVILHDQWVYAAPATVCVHGGKASFTAFGVTADLLVSGMWLHGHEPYGRLIQGHILTSYTALSRRHATTQSFAKSSEFSTKYISWFTKELIELRSLSGKPSDGLRCQCSFTGKRFLCGESVMAPDSYFLGSSTQNTSLSSQSVELYKQTGALIRFQRPTSVFRSNSTASEITLPPDKLGGNLTRIFCKRSLHPQQELEGAMNAAAFGLRVQLPHLTSSGELLYPFFKGMTESELRLSYHRSGRSNWDIAETVLYASW